jgi:hypothetical protein
MVNRPTGRTCGIWVWPACPWASSQGPPALTPSCRSKTRRGACRTSQRLEGQRLLQGSNKTIFPARVLLQRGLLASPCACYAFKGKAFFLICSLYFLFSLLPFLVVEAYPVSFRASLLFGFSSRPLLLGFVLRGFVLCSIFFFFKAARCLLAG